MRRAAALLFVVACTTAAFGAEAPSAATQSDLLRPAADAPLLPLGYRLLFAHFADDVAPMKRAGGMMSMKVAKADVIVARRLPDGSVVTGCVDNEPSAVGFMTQPAAAQQRAVAAEQ